MQKNEGATSSSSGSGSLVGIGSHNAEDAFKDEEVEWQGWSESATPNFDGDDEMESLLNDENFWQDLETDDGCGSR